jgi:hypothetical protein
VSGVEDAPTEKRLKKIMAFKVGVPTLDEKLFKSPDREVEEFFAECGITTRLDPIAALYYNQVREFGFEGLIESIRGIS